MRFVLLLELLVVLIVPTVLGYLGRRHAITSRKIALAVSTLLSVFMGTAALAISNPQSPLNASMQVWLWILGLALFVWVLAYPVTRWLLKLLFNE